MRQTNELNSKKKKQMHTHFIVVTKPKKSSQMIKKTDRKEKDRQTDRPIKIKKKQNTKHENCSNKINLLVGTIDWRFQFDSVMLRTYRYFHSCRTHITTNFSSLFFSEGGGGD